MPGVHRTNADGPPSSRRGGLATWLTAYVLLSCWSMLSFVCLLTHPPLGSPSVGQCTLPLWLFGTHCTPQVAPALATYKAHNLDGIQSPSFDTSLASSPLRPTVSTSSVLPTLLTIDSLYASHACTRKTLAEPAFVEGIPATTTEPASERVRD